jgi:6-phosphogluconolactonase/glucosamine-6-phosphate isomerase/deaminase
MKRTPFVTLCSLFMLCFSLSCARLNGNTSISISESRHYYKMLAHFSKSQTTNVDEYMDSRIGRTSNMSFVNSRIDGKLALDDHTTFYIRKYPGYVEIKLDKDENSDEAYHRIKAMCEGIKKVISE